MHFAFVVFPLTLDRINSLTYISWCRRQRIAMFQWCIHPFKLGKSTQTGSDAITLTRIQTQLGKCTWKSSVQHLNVKGHLRPLKPLLVALFYGLLIILLDWDHILPRQASKLDQNIPGCHIQLAPVDQMHAYMLHMCGASHRHQK